MEKGPKVTGGESVMARSIKTDVPRVEAARVVGIESIERD